MKLKCETIFNIYTYRNTTVLCQIKVQPSKDKLNREWKNTCRCITQEQWNSFDIELNMILKVLRAKRDKCNDEIISTFSIKPNIEVKVQKSKLSSKMFYNLMGGVHDIGGAEVSIDNIRKIKHIGYVLEFILHFKQQPRSISPVEETQEYQPKTTSLDNIYNSPLSYERYTPTEKIYRANSLLKATQKYEPKPKASPDNIFNSPLSYKPYTPSKKKYRANSLDGIKTPGVDFLEYESNIEDAYLPKSIINTTTKHDFPIPAYKPAPIKEKRSNHSCNKNEVIAETDEQLLSPMKLRTTRSDVLKKKSKHEIEYIPKSQEIINAPAYFPTPIEMKNTINKNDSQEDKNNSKYINKDKEVGKRISKRLESREKTSSKESNQDKVPDNILESNKSTFSNENDKPKFANSNKIYSKMGIKNFQDVNPENVSICSNTELAKTDVTALNKKSRKRHKLTHYDPNNDGRSPIKPKPLREEQSSMKKSKKKLKTQKSSSNNMELFGTDYEDDDDKNNDAINKKLPKSMILSGKNLKT